MCLDALHDRGLTRISIMALHVMRLQHMA